MDFSLRNPLSAASCGLLLLALSACSSHLAPLGNPEQPYAPSRPPQVGDILHLPTGYYLPESALLAAAADARIVYAGETHDNPASHRLQLKLLQALHAAHPGRVALAMEMFTPAQQAVLDRWSAGELDEKSFLKDSDWAQVWRMNFAYYRDLLRFARDQRIPVIGLNADRELVRALGHQRPEELSAEQQAELPELDMSDPYQAALVEAVYGGHNAGRAMLDGFQRIQTLWDETMAGNIAAYLQSPQGRDQRLLVVAGGNHVRNGFGIPRRVFRRLPTSYLLVGSTALTIPEGMEDRLMDVSLPAFPMSAYDYLVYTDYEILPDQVKLGVMLEQSEAGVAIQTVVPGSVAAGAGIRPGDLVVEFDGEPIGEIFDLVYAVQQKKPGDPGQLRLIRDGAELLLEVSFSAFEHGTDPHKQ